jgi:hypothetical protein
MQPELFHFAYPSAMSSKVAALASLATSTVGVVAAMAFGFIG